MGEPHLWSAPDAACQVCGSVVQACVKVAELKPTSPPGHDPDCACSDGFVADSPHAAAVDLQVDHVAVFNDCERVPAVFHCICFSHHHGIRGSITDLEQ